MLKNWRFWLGLVISGGLLVWFMQDIDLAGLAEGFALADYGILLLFIFPLTGVYLARIWRWKLLLDSIKPTRFRDAASGTMIGFMANGVLPLRAGELVRPYIITRNTGIKYSSALATVIFVRLLDGFGVMAIFLFSLFVFPIGGMMKIGLAVGVGAVYIAALVMMILLYRRREPIARILSAPARLFGEKAREKARQFFIHFGDGLHILNHAHRLWGAIALTVVVITLSIVSYIPVIQAMPFASETVWFAPAFTFAYVCLGVVFPSAPGFLGIFEAFAFMGITTCSPGIEAAWGAAGLSMAKSFAILIHVTQVLPYIIVGLIFLLREGVSLGELVRGRKKVSVDDALEAFDEDEGEES